MKKLTYLATPYTHKDHYMMVARHLVVNHVAADLMNQGYYIFSPISHTHPIAEAGKLPRGWEYWQGYDKTILSTCERLIVLQIPGWEESTGVTAEIQIATELGLPIEYIDFPDFTLYDSIVNSCKEAESKRT